jgi:hypothetical protein
MKPINASAPPCQRQEDQRVAQAGLRPLDQPVVQAGESGGHQTCAPPVDAPFAPVHGLGRDLEPQDQQGDRGERHVDEENRAPQARAGEQPAEHRPECRRQHAEGGPGADGLAAHFGRMVAGDQRE